MSDRIHVAVLLTLGLGVQHAGAGVTMDVATSGKAAFINVGGDGVTQIDGTRMRSEQSVRGEPQILIIDVEGRRFVTLDTKRKTASVIPLDAVAEELRKVGLQEIQANVKPTSETKTIAGFTCTVHEVNASFPFSMTGQPQQGMDFTMVMSGTACLSGDAPGFDAYRRFYTAAAESGFVFGDPRATKSPAAAAQARAYAAMIKSMTDAGMMLESHITMTASGTGPMAAMMSRLANSDITSTVTRVVEEELPADRFEIPADYKVKTER